MDAIAEAERERAKAADDLAVAETALKAQEKSLRAVQEKLAEAREGKARGEARLEGARERRSSLARLIREQLDCAPEECLYVGDGGSRELTGATGLGMTAVRLAAPDLAGHLVYDADEGFRGGAIAALTETVRLVTHAPARA